MDLRRADREEDADEQVDRDGEQGILCLARYWVGQRYAVHHMGDRSLRLNRYEIMTTGEPTVPRP